MSFIGDILNFCIDRIFHSGGYHASSSSVVRSYDNPSYRTNYSTSVVKSGGSVNHRFEFVDLVYPKRSDAQWLLDILRDRIAQSSKHRVTVMDLYDEIDDPSNLEMNDDKFGWTDLSGAYIREVSNGWRLFLPPVTEFRD